MVDALSELRWWWSVLRHIFRENILWPVQVLAKLEVVYFSRSAAIAVPPNDQVEDRFVCRHQP